MQIIRFFEENIGGAQTGERFVLSAENARIAHRVLRLKKSDRLQLMDGKGHVLVGSLNDVGPKRTSATILDRIDSAPAWPLLILLQGMPKGDKSAFVVQKAVEWGTSRIIFFEGEHSVSKKKNGARNRWQKIAVEAIRQSGNPFLPELIGPVSLKDALSFATGKVSLLLDETEKSKKFGSIFGEETPASVNLAVGPEGGWSASERTLLGAAGYRSVSLGPYVLRTETAAVGVLAACRAHFG